jgi:hypothetical protein
MPIEISGAGAYVVRRAFTGGNQFGVVGAGVLWLTDGEKYTPLVGAGKGHRGWVGLGLATPIYFCGF